MRFRNLKRWYHKKDISAEPVGGSECMHNAHGYRLALR